MRTRLFATLLCLLAGLAAAVPAEAQYSAAPRGPLQPRHGRELPRRGRRHDLEPDAHDARRFAVVGIIYGALVAMVQPDLKKLVAYSSVSHLGFVVLGLCAMNAQGLQGASTRCSTTASAPAGCS